MWISVGRELSFHLHSLVREASHPMEVFFCPANGPKLNKEHDGKALSLFWLFSLGKESFDSRTRLGNLLQVAWVCYNWDCLHYIPLESWLSLINGGTQSNQVDDIWENDMGKWMAAAKIKHTDQAVNDNSYRRKWTRWLPSLLVLLEVFASFTNPEE